MSSRNPIIHTTPEGYLEVVFTSATHAHLKSVQRVHGTNGPPTPHVTFNGVTYAVSAHVYLVDGEWTLNPPGERGTHIYAYRVDAKRKDATEAARRALQALLLKAVTETAREWPEIPEQAQREADHAELRRAEVGVEKAEQALEAARAELRAVRVQIGA